MTTNPHEAGDNAHLCIDRLCEDLRRSLHQMAQGIDNRAALADHWQGVADAQRAEIERQRETIARLQAENANLSAHLETVATERGELMRRVSKTEQNRNGEGKMATRPTIVCLCGSTRFSEAFQEANLRETLKGRIVLSIGCNMRSDTEIFGHLSERDQADIKAGLDELHLRKIDLADECLFLNVNGSIGESTRRELEYAQANGKDIRFLEEPGRTAPEHLEDTLDYAERD